MAIKVRVKKVKVDEEYISDFYKVNSKVKVLNKELAEMKVHIKINVGEHGITDEKGNVLLSLGAFEAKLEARTSVTLDREKTYKLLKKRKIFDDCVIITIDDSAVERAFKSGALSEADMESIITRNVTHALKVRRI